MDLFVVVIFGAMGSSYTPGLHGLWFTGKDTASQPSVWLYGTVLWGGIPLCCSLFMPLYLHFLLSNHPWSLNNRFQMISLPRDSRILDLTIVGSGDIFYISEDVVFDLNMYDISVNTLYVCVLNFLTLTFSSHHNISVHIFNGKLFYNSFQKVVLIKKIMRNITPRNYCSGNS